MLFHSYINMLFLMVVAKIPLRKKTCREKLQVPRKGGFGGTKICCKRRSNV